MDSLIIEIILFILGVFLLTYGAETVVKGSIHIAERFGLPKMVIGLTVVAFATSAPEFAVSFNATIHNLPNLAVGNVVGSCILNILLVLGIIAFATPMQIERSIIKRQIPVLVAITTLVTLFSFANAFSRPFGILLLIIIYPFLLFQKRAEPKFHAIKHHESASNLLKALFMTIAGIVMLWLGSDWVVISSQYFAKQLMLSESLVGLSIVAIGTSLPEIATSIVAKRHNEPELALGNIIGSNVFNILFVLGFSLLFVDEPMQFVDSMKHVDIPIMLVSAVVFWLLATRRKLDRLSGTVLISLYLLYTYYLLERGQLI